MKVIVAWALSATAVALVGAPGRVYGITLAEGAVAGPIPALFVATTVKVYAVPGVSPETAIGLVPPVAVIPSGEEVTV